MKLSHCIFFISSIFLFYPACSQDTTTFEIEKSKQFVESLYHSLEHKPNLTIEQRINYFSGLFLNRPYILFPLGEGINSPYDQMPKFRLDGFDCETYVDTVLALAFAANEPTFEQCMDQIRYENGDATFQHRNHFTNLDWNLNNQKQGFLKDITPFFKQSNGEFVAVESKTMINKSAWYKQLPLNRIKLPHANLETQQKQLISLQQSGRLFPNQLSVLSYIPLNRLLDDSNHPNLFLFNQIPNGAIIEIVRPNWNLTTIIGTHLDISHLGFAIWKNQELYFRHATITENKVIEIPLIDYLISAKESPTIKGINIQIAIVDKPFENTCHPTSQYSRLKSFFKTLL